MFSKLKRITALLLALMVIPSPVYAEVTNEKIEEIKQDIEINKKEKEKTEKESERISNRIDKKVKELTNLNMKLDENEQERLKQYEEMKLRIRYLYENGDDSMLTAITSSENITDVLNKKEMSSKVHQYDRIKLEEYENLINDMEEESKELDKKLEELEDLKEEKKKYEEKLSKQIEKSEEELETEIKLEEERERKRKEAEALRIPTGEVTIDNNSYVYCQEDLNLIYAIVMQECGSSYEGALAVITCACNRAESARWAYLGGDPLSQLTASGQFCYSLDNYWCKYLGGNASQCVKEAVTDALSGVRNHEYLSFRGRVIDGGLNIGGNYYFSHT